MRKKLTAAGQEPRVTSIAELFGGARTGEARPDGRRRASATSTKGRKLGKVAPKYRNPDQSQPKPGPAAASSRNGSPPKPARAAALEEFLIK